MLVIADFCPYFGFIPPLTESESHSRIHSGDTRNLFGYDHSISAWKVVSCFRPWGGQPTDGYTLCSFFRYRPIPKDLRYVTRTPNRKRIYRIDFDTWRSRIVFAWGHGLQRLSRSFFLCLHVRKSLQDVPSLREYADIPFHVSDGPLAILMALEGKLP